MRQPSYLKKVCPVCGALGVEQGASRIGLRSSSFHCPTCRADLIARPTLRSLWSLAIAALGLAGLLTINLIAHHQGWASTLRAVLFAAIGGGAWALSNRVIAEMTTLRPRGKK
jgi:hypothetical protein